jgi:hypothetical protein
VRPGIGPVAPAPEQPFFDKTFERDDFETVD